MALTDDCREIAAAMSDVDIDAALDLLGPDSPLLPAVRDEHVRRLRLRADADTTAIRSIRKAAQ